MKIQKILSVVLFLIVSSGKAYSQELAIGQWRTHLPYAKAQFVTDAGSKVFCASTDGLFSYDKNDYSISTYTKIDGLSDIGFSVIRYSSSYNVLFIGYENSNIDLLYGNQIVNISDISRANIVGGKTINDITFIGRYAYLSCSFGIVVIDLERREIKDTYYIGPGGGNINVSGIAYDGTDLFAATSSGIFRVNINNPYINLYSEWINILAPASGDVFDQIVYFNNKIYVKVDAVNNNDYLLSYDYTSWSNAGINLLEIRRLAVAQNKLVVASTYDTKMYDSSLQEIGNVDGTTYTNCSMYDATVDATGNVWIADNKKGLVQINTASQVQFILPDGPWSKRTADIQIMNGQLWVAHSERGGGWRASYSPDGFSTFMNNKWTTYDVTDLTSPLVWLDTVWDFMSIAIDPANSNHVFLGSRGEGVLEVENGAIKNYYNEGNSLLQTTVGNPGACELGGIAFDGDKNLWMVNSGTYVPLVELTKDGTWKTFSFSDATNGVPQAGGLFIDSYGQKWMTILNQGLLLFDDSRPIGSQYRLVNSAVGNGGLPSNDVRIAIEDKDGQVWLGTAQGVAVFYSPSSVLDGGISNDAQQILIEQDGHTQYLLATEVINSIAVDGANRKWFGTESSGVYLMSADGTTQLQHFTAENSPLLSNTITSIAIDDQTGEVFFGTDDGIISYRGDATAGGETCDGYLVFPNPVKHDYHGPIAISGLVNNADVKITDISGALVYHTKANGGEAIWNGNNFKGERAHTGIYLIYASNDDGSATCVTKVLFTH